MTKYGMFYGSGNKKEIVIDKRSEEAPWIAQLKSTFEDVKDKVTPYASKGNAFNAIGENMEKSARMYFVGDPQKYRVFGLGINVGDKNSSAFGSEKIESYIKDGKKAFVYDQNNTQKIQAFIDLVKANGCATTEQINEFKKMRDSLLKELGL